MRQQQVQRSRRRHREQPEPETWTALPSSPVAEQVELLLDDIDEVLSELT